MLFESIALTFSVVCIGNPSTYFFSAAYSYAHVTTPHRSGLGNT
jgi:hypothetical protein